MLVDPTRINTASDILSHPFLSRYEEFQVEMDNLCEVIRYIALTYDSYSPIMDESDVDKRKAKAVRLCGLVEEEVPPPVMMMLRGEQPLINLMILRYCRFHRGRKYTLFVASSENYYGGLSEILNFKSGKDDILDDAKLKLELMERSRKQADMLDELETELLAGDKTLGLETALEIVSSMESSIPVTPEDFAKLFYIKMGVKDEKDA